MSVPGDNSSDEDVLLSQKLCTDICKEGGGVVIELTQILEAS